MGTKTQLPTCIGILGSLVLRAFQDTWVFIINNTVPLLMWKQKNTFGLSTQLFPYKDTDVYLKIDNPLFQLN